MGWTSWKWSKMPICAHRKQNNKKCRRSSKLNSRPNNSNIINNSPRIISTLETQRLCSTVKVLEIRSHNLHEIWKKKDNTLQRKKKKFSQFKKRFVLKSLQLKKKLFGYTAKKTS